MTDITTMSRTERYCRRLDERLESTHPNERLKFLSGEKIEWIARYERFTNLLDSGKRSEHGEHAVDYIETLAAINERIAREEKP